MKEWSLGRIITVGTTTNLTLASLYGMIHEWNYTTNAIFCGVGVFLFGLLTLYSTTKMDKVNWRNVLPDRRYRF